MPDSTHSFMRSPCSRVKMLSDSPHIISTSYRGFKQIINSSRNARGGGGVGLDGT